MAEESSQLRLSFPQLLVLLTLQVVLLAGAFYLGTRLGGGGGNLFAAKKSVKDMELAKLLPEGDEGKTISVPDAKKEEGDRTVTTPFDKSASTVFRIKSSSNSEYTVQVASYPDESAATQVVEEWKKKGYMAFLSVEEIPDRGRWYRVNVGNFGDERAADTFAKTIEAKEKITPQVIVNE